MSEGMKRRAAIVVASVWTVLAVGATGAAATAQAQPARPAVLWVHVTPASLGRFGGVVDVSGAVRGASSCRLQLVSVPPMAVGYSTAAKTCKGGTFRAHVVIAANPGPAVQPVSFTLMAKKGPASSRGRFTVGIAGLPPAAPAAGTGPTGPAPTSPGPTTPTTTATPPTDVGTTTSTTVLTFSSSPPTTSASTTSSSTPPTSSSSSTTTTTAATTTTTLTNINHASSSNWSGYAATSGPYTAVSGTFTVPGLTSQATCTEELSEWVGVDGYSNQDLIQAGVGESMVGPYDNETCTPGHYYLWAWWEVLPASMTPVAMTVDAGDSVTVDLSEVSAGVWDIRVVDNTSRASFSQEESYGGPASAVEWVVEAPYDQSVCSGTGGYCIPDPYSPSVSFSAVTYSGNTTAAYDVTMTKSVSGAPVTFSTPSSLSDWPGNFSVSYTGGGTNAPNAGPNGEPPSSPLAARSAAGGQVARTIFEG